MSHWERNGKSDDWYTPKSVFDALECNFDTDVAGKYVPAYCVPARTIITHDSLSVKWEGFVWMNPPFGGRNALGPWMDKFFSHKNGIALTPDRTSAPWFMSAWSRANLVMFTPKIRFMRDDGQLGKSPSNGTALWASGITAALALRRAQINGLGIVAKPTFFYDIESRYKSSAESYSGDSE